MLFNNQPYVGQKKASLSLRLGAAFGILYLNVPLFFMHLQPKIHRINFRHLVILVNGLR